MPSIPKSIWPRSRLESCIFWWYRMNTSLRIISKPQERLRSSVELQQPKWRKIPAEICPLMWVDSTPRRGGYFWNFLRGCFPTIPLKNVSTRCGHAWPRIVTRAGLDLTQVTRTPSPFPDVSVLVTLRFSGSLEHFFSYLSLFCKTCEPCERARYRIFVTCINETSFYLQEKSSNCVGRTKWRTWARAKKNKYLIVFPQCLSGGRSRTIIEDLLIVFFPSFLFSFISGHASPCNDFRRLILISLNTSISDELVPHINARRARDVE